MDMMPVMNVFNEWHAANTSRKIRAVLDASRRGGKYTGWNYPYGYRAGDDRMRTAVADEEAACVVRRIYDMRLRGFSARRIAELLTGEGIPNPAAHFTRRDGACSKRRRGSRWVPKTVMDILKDPVYLGRTTQRRTTRVSYKNHAVVKLPEAEWIVRENAHEPLISRETWESVQEINRSRARGRENGKREVRPLSGLLVCPDCGKKMKARGSGGGTGYICRTYADLGKKYCASHYISERLLQTLVLRDIRSLLGAGGAEQARACERALRERASREKERRFAAEKQQRACDERLAALDALLRAAFEEKVARRLSEEAFSRLCAGYEAERESVRRRRDEAARQAGAAREDDAAFSERFARYARCDSLSRELCLQLIERVEVGEAKGDAPRELRIYYKASCDLSP